MCGRLRQVAVLGLVWLLCLATTLGCTVAVYAFSEFMIQVRAAPGAPGRGSDPCFVRDGSPVTGPLRLLPRLLIF